MYLNLYFVLQYRRLQNGESFSYLHSQFTVEAKRSSSLSI